MDRIIVGLYEDWLWLDERIESTISEIELISKKEGDCQRLMTVRGIGPMISTAIVAAARIAWSVLRHGRSFDENRIEAAAV